MQFVGLLKTNCPKTGGRINFDHSIHKLLLHGRIPQNRGVTLCCESHQVQKTNAYQATWTGKALLMATHNWIRDTCIIQQRSGAELQSHG